MASTGTIPKGAPNNSVFTMMGLIECECSGRTGASYTNPPTQAIALFLYSRTRASVARQK